MDHIANMAGENNGLSHSIEAYLSEISDEDDKVAGFCLATGDTQCHNRATDKQAERLQALGSIII